MKASQLIKELQEIVADHGDQEVLLKIQMACYGFGFNCCPRVGEVVLDIENDILIIPTSYSDE